MKFVALALALLLAVGSQAASLQADAPSQLAHARAALDVYLTQVKDSAKRALDQLDGTEYTNLKATLSQRLEDMHTQIKTLQGAVAPMTDSVVSTLSDATTDFRTTIMTDVDTLKSQIESKFPDLKNIMAKHLKEYSDQLEPIIREYSGRHNAEMETLRTKLEPVVEELRTKITTNVEETKAALMPIVEAVRTKLSERLENLKETASPYVEEYKEQLKAAYSQAQNVNTDDLDTLRQKIAPLAEDVKTKLQTIFETIAATITKQ